MWRVRAEMQDAAGPWSAMGAFTTVGAGGTVSTTPTSGRSRGSASSGSAAGSALAFARHAGRVGSFLGCQRLVPAGLGNVNNPWQDRVIDAFRQIDSRWGYNGKPTKSAAVDNNGGAGDGCRRRGGLSLQRRASQGSFDVHLVDMLVGHCGSAPSLTWRVFTGEEPGFWTGVGASRPQIRRRLDMD